MTDSVAATVRNLPLFTNVFMAHPSPIWIVITARKPVVSTVTPAGYFFLCGLERLIISSQRSVSTNIFDKKIFFWKDEY